MATPLLATWHRLSRWPGGRWLFSRAVCFKAPYFGSIAPRFEQLQADRCEASIPDRRRVHNHIGGVHAIALCNLAELCAGVMTDAGLPQGMRWIPKGMTVHYLKRAQGRLRGIATPVIPFVAATSGYELPVAVEVLDRNHERVFSAEIRMWISPKKSAAAAPGESTTSPR